MKTIEVKLYQFSELSEESKQKAIESLWDINVDYEWWQFIYEDADNIGVRITGFDIGRSSFCQIEPQLDCKEIAQNIFEQHGHGCDTYKATEEFCEKNNPLFASYMDETHENYESGEVEDDMLYYESEFLKDLSNCYLSMLRNEYEYRTSEEAIIQAIEANGYDFTEDGRIY